MIKQSTIDEVRSRMDTMEVLSSYGVVFKRDKACCPFHNEKSASFHIWKRQNLYKCFGCGKNGDAITFLMDYERKTFTESIEILAARYNIAVEYDQVSKEESQEIKDERQEMQQLLRWCQKKYEDALHTMPLESDVWQYLLARGYDAEICKHWSLGFAPDDWKFTTSSIINMGKLSVAQNCGLVKTSQGKSYDFLRNRITIPIHNASGVLVGFGGRDVSGAKDQPKYLNPSESLVYNKQQIWFGLDKAVKAIKDTGYAYVVEGYFDVTSWHEGGIENTVAGCGTEITETQARILKRYTDHVVITLDGDAPGLKKMLKLVDLFLKLDFKVETVELPDNQDPDEYKRQYFGTLENNVEAELEYENACEIEQR